MKRALYSFGLVLFGLSVVLPFLWVLISSFKSGPEIVNSPWAPPKGLHFANYVNAWNQAHIGQFFLNSLLVTVITIGILLPISAMAAYIFAKFPFKGSGTVFSAVVAGMMFPQFLTIVPLFFLVKGMGMLNSLPGLIIVYVAYSISFTVFVLYGFFQALPNELMEAATIDGAGYNTTFWRVMLPLAKPGLIVVAIFNMIGLWNEYNIALILLSSKENFTLPLGVAKLTMVQQYQADWGALFAALVIVMVPVTGVYWLFRERIQQAMLAGAVKG